MKIEGLPMGAPILEINEITTLRQTLVFAVYFSRSWFASKYILNKECFIIQYLKVG